MPAGGSWTERTAWLHLTVLVVATVVYWAGLFWAPAVEFFVPFGAQISVFPPLFGLSLTLGLRSGRASARASVHRPLGRSVVALSGVMLLVSVSFSLLYVAVAQGDWDW